MGIKNTIISSTPPLASVVPFTTCTTITDIAYSFYIAQVRLAFYYRFPTLRYIPEAPPFIKMIILTRISVSIIVDGKELLALPRKCTETVFAPQESLHDTVKLPYDYFWGVGVWGGGGGGGGWGGGGGGGG